MARMQRGSEGLEFVGSDFDRYTLLDHRHRDHYSKRRLTPDDDSLYPRKWSGRDANTFSHGESVRLRVPQVQTTAENLDLMIADGFVERTSAHDPNYARRPQDPDPRPR